MSKVALARETALDEQYLEMYQTAMLLAQMYLQTISAVIHSPVTERELHTHLLISVRIRTPRSWTVTWCKKVPVQETLKSQREVEGLRKHAKYAPGRYVTRELPKGARDRYPNTTFNALPVEVRGIAIYYEGFLAKLRTAAKGNRALKKAERYCIDRGAKALAECSSSLAELRQVQAALEYSGLRDLQPLADLLSRPQKPD